MTAPDALFSPIRIGNKTAPNRIALNAMECNDADEKGNPSPRTHRRYREYFQGGAGFIDLEAITVTDESRGRKNQLSVMPRNEKALKKLVDEVKAVNRQAVFVWQTTHSGELSHPDFSRRVTVRPHADFGGELLGEEDVQKILDQFVLAAKIAHNCGADGIDFKVCHGYLGSQLLRPYNDRKWKWGGPWENRARFVFEGYERIAREINDPDFIVGSKISFWEGFPGGFGSAGPDTAVIDYEEPIKLVRGLEERGAHYIMVSAGCPSFTLALSQPDRRIPDQVYLHHTFQKVARDNLQPQTVVIGSAYSIFRDGKNNLQPRVDPEKKSFAHWASKNVSDGVCDMVAIGRQSLADCALPRKFAEGTPENVNWCTACDSCVELLIRQQQVGCVVYDRESARRLKTVRDREGPLAYKLT